MSKVKAVGLFSGGLDSILACKVLQEQGIEVIGVYFFTPFFSNPKGIEGIAEKYNIPLVVKKVLSDYVEILKNPKFGYGKNFNPCIDCHGFMLRKAGELMQELTARFVFTGEVLGERPFSQTYYGLKRVEELSGLAGYVLRPLSAKLLPTTIPEKQGWVDRERLYAIKGRNRGVQFELAERYGIEIEGTLQPAGGCLLTDPFMSKRIKNYVRRFKNSHNVIWDLIKTGRHFVLAKETALIVGRNRFENEVIEKYEKKGVLLKTEEITGPVAILFGEQRHKDKVRTIAAQIVASYCKRGNFTISVCFSDTDEKIKVKQRARNCFKDMAI